MTRNIFIQKNNVTGYHSVGGRDDRCAAAITAVVYRYASVFRRSSMALRKFRHNGKC